GRHEDGVPEAEGFSLSDVRDVDHVGDLAHFLELFGLPARLQKRLELDVDVEVIFDRIFPTAGEENGVVDAGGDGLFHSVLNDWLVHQRQHFLGLRLGGRQKAGAETGGGEHG